MNDEDKANQPGRKLNIQYGRLKYLLSCVLSDKGLDRGLFGDELELCELFRDAYRQGYFDNAER